MAPATAVHVKPDGQPAPASPPLLLLPLLLLPLPLPLLPPLLLPPDEDEEGRQLLAHAVHERSAVVVQEVTALGHMVLTQLAHEAPPYELRRAQPASPPLLVPLLLPLPLDEPELPPSWPPPDDDPVEPSSPGLPNPVLLLLLEHAATAARPARVTVKMALCICALRTSRRTTKRARVKAGPLEGRLHDK
jgi:hypothetical protein